MTLKDLAAQAAMEILNDVTPRVGAGTTLYPGTWEGIVRKAVRSAYRSGAEQMRKRCAGMADITVSFVTTDAIAGVVSKLSRRIRALPLTEDDDGQEGKTGSPPQDA